MTSLARADWVILVGFLLTNVLIVLGTQPDANLSGAADGGSWYEPVLAFLRYGAFVELSSPDMPNLYRPPLFPVFGAGLMTLFGSESPFPIVVGQIAVLLVSGVIFRAVVEEVAPGYGALGMALYLFNPNVLSTAHLIQSETLFSFFLLVSFWAVCVRNGHVTWGRSLLTGLALGLACLVRPTPQFLILVLPLGMVALAVLAGRGASWVRALMQGAAATVLALAIVAPWAHYVNQYDGVYALAPNDIKYRYVYDQITIIEAQIHGLSYHEADDRMDQLVPEHAQVHACKQSPVYSDSYSACYGELVSKGFARLLSYPIADFAKALFRSVGQFGVAGGAGNWHNILGLDTNGVSATWFEASQGSVLEIVKAVLQPTSLPAFLFTLVSLGYVVVLRLLGGVGLGVLLWQRHWSIAAIIVAYIAYFALITIFVGNSRYRVPVEPALVLLAVVGAAAVKSRILPNRPRLAASG